MGVKYVDRHYPFKTTNGGKMTLDNPDFKYMRDYTVSEGDTIICKKDRLGRYVDK